MKYEHQSEFCHRSPWAHGLPSAVAGCRATAQVVLSEGSRHTSRQDTACVLWFSGQTLGRPAQPALTGTRRDPGFDKRILLIPHRWPQVVGGSNMNSLLHAAVVRMGVDQQCVRGCTAFAHMAVDSVQLLHTYEWSLQVHEACDQPGTVWNVDQ